MPRDLPTGTVTASLVKEVVEGFSMRHTGTVAPMGESRDAARSPEDERDGSEEPTLGDDAWPTPPSYSVPHEALEQPLDERRSPAGDRSGRNGVSAAWVAALIAVFTLVALLGFGGAWLVAGLTDSADGRSGASASRASPATASQPTRTEPGSPTGTTAAAAATDDTTPTDTTPTDRTREQRTTTVTMPSLIGLPVGRALRELRALGLRGSTHRVVSRRRPATVVHQHPSRGQRIERGGVVRLEIARPAPVETARVPSLVGTSAAEARRRLGGVELRWSVSTVPAEQVEGTVVRQSPAAGANVRKGTTVALEVSSGPPLVSVPDVVGDPEEAGRATLESAGFEVTVVEEPSEDPAMDGVVTRQDPPASTRAREGSSVTMVVGRLTQPPPTG